MTSFIIESSICLAGMLILYKLLLSKTSLHQLKRIFLLACLIIPLGVPFINFEIFYNTEQIATIPTSFKGTANADYLEHLISEPNENPRQEATIIEETNSDKSFDWNVWLLVSYLSITTILLLRLLFNVVKILTLAERGEHEQHESYRLIILQRIGSAYSFFRYIFIDKLDFQEERTKTQLLAHELVHVRQLHSLDIILIELFKAVFWFSPCYYLISRYTKLNHEYIADAGVISATNNRKAYQNMLLQFYQRPKVNSTLVSPTDYSFIKNRFQMMHKRTSQKSAASRLLLLIPLLGGILFTLGMDLKPKPAKILTDTITESIKPLKGFPIKGVEIAIDAWFNQEDKIPWSPSENIDNYPGLDLTNGSNQTVIATGEGIIKKAVKNDDRYGNYVLIDHQNGFKTLYASLDELRVKEGESSFLGLTVGTTGRSMTVSNLGENENRLHYAISENDEWIDPTRYIKIKVNKAVNASQAKQAIRKPIKAPTALPFDPTVTSYLSYGGSIGKREPEKHSVYDKIIGTEFFVNASTLVRATESGSVKEIIKDHNWLGQYVVIEHENGFETLYAKLTNVSVEIGDRLNKGDVLGTAGNSEDMYGRIHYKIKINDRYTWSQYLEKGPNLGSPPFKTLSKPASPDESFGLSRFVIPWSFTKEFSFKQIVYNDQKAVFVKHNGEVITKKATELSPEQKAAILTLRAKPYVTKRNKRAVPEEVYSRWEKPWVYKIYIDGKNVESKEMVNYKPEDFSDCSWVVVSKTVKEKYGHAFELYLSTELYYQKKLKERREAEFNWKTYTKEKLKVFSDI